MKIPFVKVSQILQTACNFRLQCRSYYFYNSILLSEQVELSQTDEQLSIAKGNLTSTSESLLRAQQSVKEKQLEHDGLVRELVAVQMANERVLATLDRADGQRVDFSVERAIREGEVGGLDESHLNRRRSSSSGDKLEKEMEEMQRVIDELQDYSEFDRVEKYLIFILLQFKV
jgi:hypothetical protein